MAVVNKPVNNKCWQECGERGTLVHCWWQLVQPLWIAIKTYLKKINNETPNDSNIKSLLEV